MAVTVILELHAKPGRRAELSSLLESLVANHGPSERGFLGNRRYEVLDELRHADRDADWESAEARVAHMEEAGATGVYAPLVELSAAPFRTTVIRLLP